jgi:hypothetical protein
MTGMPPRACYAIDADDRIVWTDAGFADLAQSHGQPGLATGALGRPLIEFVAGERPRALQQALIARARRAAGTEPLELRYRCDSPEMRRFAVLQMARQPDDRVLFTTWFEATEPRHYQPLLDPATPRGDGASTRLCAWCNRIDPGDGWREVEDEAHAQTAADARPPAVEHGLCEICELLLTGPLGRPGAGPKSSGPSGHP